MTIYQITTDEKKDLINFAVKDKFKDHEEFINNCKTMSGQNLDINLINQRIEFINSYDFFVINREAFANEDRMVLQMFKSILSFMRKTRPIFIWQGISEDYKKELIKEGIKNLVCGDTLDEQKEEILECFSEKGMQRYNTNWKTSGTDNFEKYVFREDKTFAIQVLTTDNLIRCRSMTLSLCMYLNQVGGKVAYNAPLLSENELLAIANLIQADTQYNEDYGTNYYTKENITLSNDPDFINSNLERYDFMVQDLGFFDENNYIVNKESIVDDAFDKNVIVCDLNRLEIDNVRTISNELGSKILLVNSFDNIKFDDLQGIDLEYFGLLDKANKIKKLEKQEDIIDIRTNRNLFYSLIEPHITATSVEGS